MNISLSSFCKENGLPKSSVYRRCQELNIRTSDGLNDEDCSRLLKEFGKPTPIATPQVTVETGSDLILAAPELPQAYDLQGLRQSEALVIEDPIEFAQKFLALADQVKTAMQHDIAARELRLQATRQAKNAIEAQAAELKLETRLYQLQATNLDKTLTQETVALQEAAQTLKPLGKGQAG